VLGLNKNKRDAGSELYIALPQAVPKLGKRFLERLGGLAAIVAHSIKGEVKRKYFSQCRVVSSWLPARVIRLCVDVAIVRRRTGG